jgi:hypothetical protein
MSDLTPELAFPLTAVNAAPGNGRARVRMSDLTPGLDPRPEPPRPPGPDDCCHSGCTWCVFDLYQEELERYQQALKEWEARQQANKR